MFQELVERLKSLPPDSPDRETAMAELADEFESGLVALFVESDFPQTSITGLVLMRMGLRSLFNCGVSREDVEAEVKNHVEFYVADKTFRDEAKEIRRVAYATDPQEGARLH